MSIRHDGSPIFAKFRGRFKVIQVDTELYDRIGKHYHQDLGVPIYQVAKLVYAKTGRPLVNGVRGIAHNLMVETGRELHAALMVNSYADWYVGPTPYIYPQYIHVGDGTTPPVIDDWALESPWPLPAGIYTITTATRVSISHCQWEATIPNTDLGTLAEAGLFLNNAAPINNPQTDPSQRPFSMLHRALFPTPIVKGATTEVIQFEAIF